MQQSLLDLFLHAMDWNGFIKRCGIRSSVNETTSYGASKLVDMALVPALALALNPVRRHAN